MYRPQCYQWLLTIVYRTKDREQKNMKLLLSLLHNILNPIHSVICSPGNNNNNNEQ